MQFIIDIEDKGFKRNTGEGKLFRAKGFRSLVFDENGLKKLKPYDGSSCRSCGNVYSAYREGLEEGKKQMWEAAKKIVLPKGEGGISEGSEFDGLFGNIGVRGVFSTLSAAEAIDKVASWEKERVKPGDEIKAPAGNAVVTRVKDGRGYFLYQDGSVCSMKASDMERTGRNFPGLAELLDWLRETEDIPFGQEGNE